MAIKIYTKTGDKGQTSLIGGTRVSKSSLRIEAYGTVDELNAYLGLVADMWNDPPVTNTLRLIQDRMFTMGCSLATDPGKTVKMQLPELQTEDVVFLESEIDQMNEVLPEMKNFILPGGSPLVATIHIGRCVCRRAERVCIVMKEEGEFVDDLVIMYLNRLSDYLFVLARYAAHLHQVPEVIWKPRL